MPDVDKPILNALSAQARSSRWARGRSRRRTRRGPAKRRGRRRSGGRTRVPEPGTFVFQAVVVPTGSRQDALLAGDGGYLDTPARVTDLGGHPARPTAKLLDSGSRADRHRRGRRSGSKLGTSTEDQCPDRRTLGDESGHQPRRRPIRPGSGSVARRASDDYVTSEYERVLLRVYESDRPGHDRRGAPAVPLDDYPCTRPRSRWLHVRRRPELLRTATT